MLVSVLRIRDDPDIYPSRIPDPTRAPKEEGENKFFVLPFFVAANIIKICNKIYFWEGENKFFVLPFFGASNIKKI
jgi:hypothetical protein